MHPVHRRSARVPPVDRHGDVLLLLGRVEGSELVGPVHRGSHAFSFDGVDHLSDATFFAVRVDDVTVHVDGLEEAEVGNVVDARWWKPADLASGLSLSDLDLPAIADAAVAAALRPGGGAEAPGRSS